MQPRAIILAAGARKRSRRSPFEYPLRWSVNGLSNHCRQKLRIREHSHGDQIELQICFRGNGRVMVDGIAHPLVPGTACFWSVPAT